jgi:hypothetical protein
MIQINFTEDELEYMRQLMMIASEEEHGLSDDIHFRSIFNKFMSAS